MKRAKQKINTLEIVAQPSKTQFRLGLGRAQTIHSAIAAAFIQFQFPILQTERILNTSSDFRRLGYAFAFVS